MYGKISNLVFEGAGILGIAYLGVLKYLYENNLMKDIKRTAGTSSGAIAACISSLNLPFRNIKNYTDSLRYDEIPEKGINDGDDPIIHDIVNIIDPLLLDINCIYRLFSRYGWFSTKFIYDWIKDVIAEQFNSKKKVSGTVNKV